MAKRDYNFGWLSLVFHDCGGGKDFLIDHGSKLTDGKREEEDADDECNEPSEKKKKKKMV
jgi:hypothetical protein